MRYRRLSMIVIIAWANACAPMRQPATGAADPEAASSAADPAALGSDSVQPAITPEQRAFLRVDSIIIAPNPIALRRGESLPLSQLRVTMLDDTGQPVENVPFETNLMSGVAGLVEDEIQTHKAGEAELRFWLSFERPEGVPWRLVMTRVPLIVQPDPVSRIGLDVPDELYVGAAVSLSLHAYTAQGDLREDVEPRWSSDDPTVANVDALGFVRGVSPGRARVTAEFEGVRDEATIEVIPNPVRSLELTPTENTVRVGDVVRFKATARDQAGGVVEDAPIVFTVRGGEEWELGGASVYADGAFAAGLPGVYRVVATAGSVSTSAVVRAERREIEMDAVLVGQGIDGQRGGADLWVFEGMDGRDYAYLGGRGVYAWDVTDPRQPVLTDSVMMDGRRINDVKVTEDARYAIATNEGASDRKNGIIILDLADPAHPKPISEYNETMTGGVHNVFIVDRMVYAVHNGTRDMHIISIEDPLNPKEVGRWGLENVGRLLHDVWVVDGLLYASYWDDGVWILDVGNGRWGGTPSEPVVVSHYAYPEGSTHAAFPYRNSAGQHYLFVGDERRDEGVYDTGLIHVIDINDPENPTEVARYKAPGAPAHNLWLEDDKLYIAYYARGLRVLDVSGELRGQLHRQGREIASFDTGTPLSRDPNIGGTWGPQPYKGNVFLSDYKSGLWIVRLRPKDPRDVL